MLDQANDPLTPECDTRQRFRAFNKGERGVYSALCSTMSAYHIHPGTRNVPSKTASRYRAEDLANRWEIRSRQCYSNRYDLPQLSFMEEIVDTSRDASTQG